MPSSIIAIGTTNATSTPFTVAAGETVGVMLVSSVSGFVVPGATAQVQAQTAGGQYVTLAELVASDPAVAINAPGTYRIFRPAGISVGVDRL